MRLTKEEMGRRIREGVKAVIEQVLEEKMTEHLAAGYRERTPSRRGERNGYHTRDLITPAGRIAQLRVPRDREAHVQQSERGVVAEELQEVFVARRRGTAESLARGFVERYGTGTGGRWRCLPRVWLLSRQGNTVRRP